MTETWAVTNVIRVERKSQGFLQMILLGFFTLEAF